MVSITVTGAHCRKLILPIGRMQPQRSLIGRTIRKCVSSSVIGPPQETDLLQARKDGHTSPFQSMRTAGSLDVASPTIIQVSYTLNSCFLIPTAHQRIASCRAGLCDMPDITAKRPRQPTQWLVPQDPSTSQSSITCPGTSRGHAAQQQQSKSRKRCAEALPDAGSDYDDETADYERQQETTRERWSQEALGTLGDGGRGGDGSEPATEIEGQVVDFFLGEGAFPSWRVYSPHQILRHPDERTTSDLSSRPRKDVLKSLQKKHRLLVGKPLLRAEVNNELGTRRLPSFPMKALEFAIRKIGWKEASSVQRRQQPARVDKTWSRPGWAPVNSKMEAWRLTPEEARPKMPWWWTERSTRKKTRQLSAPSNSRKLPRISAPAAPSAQVAPAAPVPAEADAEQVPYSMSDDDGDHQCTECPYCFKKYDLSENRPLQTLPCSHPICSKCWSRSNGSDSNCYTCRGVVQRVLENDTAMSFMRRLAVQKAACTVVADAEDSIVSPAPVPATVILEASRIIDNPRSPAVISPVATSTSTRTSAFESAVAPTDTLTDQGSLHGAAQSPSVVQTFIPDIQQPGSHLGSSGGAQASGRSLISPSSFTPFERGMQESSFSASNREAPVLNVAEAVSSAMEAEVAADMLAGEGQHPISQGMSVADEPGSMSSSGSVRTSWSLHGPSLGQHQSFAGLSPPPPFYPHPAGGWVGANLSTPVPAQPITPVPFQPISYPYGILPPPGLYPWTTWPYS